MNNAHSERASVALRKLAEFDPAFMSLSLWAHHRDTDGMDVSKKTIDENGNIQEDVRKFELAPAYTDGRVIYYGTEFEKWQIEAQMAVCAHEITHIAFRHVNRGKALAMRFGHLYDNKVFNIAADAITNETLRLAGYRLPGNCIYLVELLDEVFDEKTTAREAVGEWDVERLYMRIMKQQNSAPQGGQSSEDGQGTGQGAGQGQGQDQDDGQDKGQGQGKGQDQDQNSDNNQGQGQGQGQDQNDQSDGNSFANRAKSYASGKDYQDDMDTSGKTTPEDAQEDNEWQQRVERALRAGQQAGRGLGTLGHQIADLPKSKVPWESILRRVVNKAVTRSPRLSYTKPARQWIGSEDNARLRGLPTPAFQPGFVKLNTQPRISVGIDASGSIGNVELEIFSGEIASIGKRTGAEIHVYVFDTMVRSYQKLAGIDFEAEVKKIEFARGGGTSFIEVMDRLEEHDPSIILMLTDLLGPFREEKPKVPVIWATVNERSPEPPYGQLLSLAA